MDGRKKIFTFASTNANLARKFMNTVHRLNISKLALKHLIILLLMFIKTSTVNAQVVNNGILRLQTPDQLNEKIIDLSGNWQFYYGKHLSAAEMQSIPAGDKEYIKTPSAWNYRPQTNKKLPSYGIATYYLKIFLNKCPKDKNIAWFQQSVEFEFKE